MRTYKELITTIVEENGIAAMDNLHNRIKVELGKNEIFYFG